MAQQSDSEFSEISISVFHRIGGNLPFDVYIRRAQDQYTRLFLSGEPVDKTRLKQYEIIKGVQSLFVTQEDYKQYLLYVEKVAAQLFEDPEKASTEEIVDLVMEMTSLTILEMMVDHHVDPTSVNHATKTIQGCLELVAKDPRSLFRLFRLMGTHPYMMKHAISATVMALAIARLEKLESEKSLTALGLGALLHDLGMSMLSFDAEEKTELTAPEWKEMKEHPQLGKRMLESIKSLPSEVRMIVLQHHEQPNGMGYPNGMHDTKIYYLAKIVAVADAFTALTCKRPFRDALHTPVKAIELMREDRGKYDMKILEQCASLFINVKSTKS